MWSTNVIVHIVKSNFAFFETHFASLSIALSDTKRTVNKGQSSEIFAVVYVLTDKRSRETRVDDARRKVSEKSKETRKRTNLELVNNEKGTKCPSQTHR